MEVNIWGCLWNMDEGPFLMRQCIPEVCVFKGNQLDAWYYSNSSGLILRRTKHTTLRDLVEVFCTAAGEPVSDETPVAILRRQTTRLGDTRAPLDVPHASLITAKELRKLMSQVESGMAEPDIWSVQTFVQPPDGLRIVSIYGCDVTGHEKSDIFARQFRKAYSLVSAMAVIPAPEDVGDDSCISLSASRRAVVEAKTLSVVRFTSRFHNLDFDGLILEFLFTAEGTALLHGCWCATLVPQGARKWLRTRTPVSGNTSFPRTFPIPIVDIHANSTPREVPAMDPFQPLLTSRAAGACNSVLRSKMEGGPVEQCCVLLELWRAEEFIGEVMLPSYTRGAGSSEQTLRLVVGDTAWPSRPDMRKQLAAAQTTAAEVFITLSVEWVSRGAAQAPTMRLALLRAEGFSSSGPEPRTSRGKCPGPRALLWQRVGGCSGFSALWTSPEGTSLACSNSTEADTSNSVEWYGTVDLALDNCPRSQARRNGSRRAISAGHTESTRPSPRSAIDPLQRNPQCPIELQTSVKSPYEHVCGAEFATHWGMSERDGTMRTRILFAQVSQRLRKEGSSRLTRSSILSKIASQLEEYDDLQLEWEQELVAAKAALEQGAHAIASKTTESVRAQEEIRTLIETQEKRLASLCRELCSKVNDAQVDEHKNEAAVAQSQQRVTEQKRMLNSLKDKTRILQVTIDQTVQKFEEITNSYALLKKELEQGKAAHGSSSPHDPQPALSGSQTLLDEVAQEEHTLQALKLRRTRLHAELAIERKHWSRLEDFVRRIAKAPSAKMRSGGGLGNALTLKKEAAMLVQEMAQG